MAKKTFLDFESPIAELETKIEELRYVQTESAVDISDEIEQLSKKSQQLTKDIYSSLSPWQITKIARHAERPYTLDYVRDLFTDFVELHGDRHFADDLSIVGGLARFNGHACMVLGHQKGRDTKERAARNFGMTRPEGYRKALRLMKLAERFRLEQVLVNLLQNALDALRDHADPRIGISVGTTPTTVTINVRDNGTGLSPEAQGNLFIPFATTKVTGLGLGLVISGDIAREFGGDLRLEPDDGPGASFTLELPRAP